MLYIYYKKKKEQKNMSFKHVSEFFTHARSMLFMSLIIVEGEMKRGTS